MILQRIVFPGSEKTEEELYLRKAWDAECACEPGEPLRIREPYPTLRFDTYFNEFSLGKWRKYTRVGQVALRLSLCGRARVTLLSLALSGDPSQIKRDVYTERSRLFEKFTVQETELCSQTVESGGEEAFTFRFPEDVEGDALAFSVKPLSADFTLFGGAYETAGQEEADARPVDLAIAICTYRREEFVERNISMLEREVFEQPRSVLHGHLKAYVADNGRTLPPDRWDPEHVVLMPNHNSGGSGGFSRSMITACEDPSFRATHILLMDDDITFRVESLERTYSFLRLLRPEWKEAEVGGAMLYSTRRTTQHAAGERFLRDNIVPYQRKVDLRLSQNVLLNEQGGEFSYQAWWYCCMPVEVIRENGYALPLFVQYDDVEYGLRTHGMPKLTLNGICCWHIPFEEKRSSVKEYYTIRNFTILMALHCPQYTGRRFSADLVRLCRERTFRYDFREVRLFLRAAEDFLKGLPWLASQDPEALNRALIESGNHPAALDTLPMAFDKDKLLSQADVDHDRVRHLLRMLCLNGWLLPADREAIVDAEYPPRQFFFRARRVLKYDHYTGRGWVVEKSYREALYILCKTVKVALAARFKYRSVAREYRRLAGEYSSAQFWHRFLEF